MFKMKTHMQRSLSQMALAFCMVAAAAFAAHAQPAPEKMPTFTVVDLEGKTVESSRFAGKTLIVDFWATWCETCEETVPTLAELSRKYAGQGLVVIGISVDKGSDAKVRKAAQKLGMDYAVFRDKENALAAVFGFKGIPSLYVYDRKGKLALAMPGYDPDQEKQLETAVKTALSTR
jgi:cytochrome c biogenesis protein CcmG, thiol:disulfide interchange protein DsbE